MKKDLLIVPTYIALTLFLTCILAVFFVLYPLPSIGAMEYSVYVLDVFLYATLFLLPMIAVLSLVIIVVRAIKLASTTMLSFLLYVFLCLSTWLLLIPLFLFLSPENSVSLLITGESPSVATVFFQSDSLSLLNEHLGVYSLRISSGIITIFSDLLLLRETAVAAGLNGRIAYLVFASLGLALSSLYSLRFVSKWKLINVAAVLFLWVFIVAVNALLYRNEWELYLTTEWTLFVINIIITCIVSIIGVVSTSKHNNQKKEGV